jgi:outer membrane protein OmpA-like peptidoglycan-associated protein
VQRKPRAVQKKNAPAKPAPKQQAAPKPAPKKQSAVIEINPDKPLSQAAQRMLRSGLNVLRKNPRAKINIKIKAHKGSGPNNLEIDRKTAAVVKNFYVKSGIKASRINVEFVD